MRSGQMVLYVHIAIIGFACGTSSVALADTNADQPNESVPDSSELQQVVVTATRQAENISRVPVSVSAFTQDDLDKVDAKTIADVVRFTPGITIQPDTNNIVIRGISSNAGAGTTGLYIDDTPVQVRNLSFNSNDALPAIFDLDRVEILRGPQGTLFGAGSEGGTVRYITAQPGLTQYSGYARTEISQVAGGGVSDEVGVAGGGPIVNDLLGFRASAYYQHLAGWIDQVDSWTGITSQRNANFSDQIAGSLAFAWQPVEGLLVTPGVRYQRLTANNDPSYTVGASNPANDVFRQMSPEQHYGDDRYSLTSLNIQYDFGAFRLIANSGYYSRRDRTGYDGTIYNLQYWDQLLQSPSCAQTCNRSLYPLLTATGINPAVPQFISPAPSYISQRDLTQEVRLQTGNTDSRITGVVGVFLETADQGRISWIDDPRGDLLIPTIFGQSFDSFYGEPQILGTKDFYIDVASKDKQIAGFADVTAKLIGGLKVSAGFREAATKFSFHSYSNGALNGGVNTSQGNSSANASTPKVTMTYEFDPGNLVYATRSQGFRAGGANQTVPVAACAADLATLGLKSSPNEYSPDKVTNWEVGDKNTLLGNRLSVALSAFDMTWKGIQQNVYLPTCGFQFTDNIGSARSTGFDLQLAGRIYSRLTLRAALGYDRAVYTDTTTVGPGAVIAVKGDSLGPPPWTASLGAQDDFEILGRVGFVRADYQYASELKALTTATDPRTTSYIPGNLNPSARSYLDLRLGMSFSDLEVSLFANNLLNSAPRLQRTVDVADAYVIDETWRPLTAGITVSERF